jgi:ssDNA-binding Zn-finger/Zn-ribbon topoisomerase 1
MFVGCHNDLEALLIFSRQGFRDAKLFPLCRTKNYPVCSETWSQKQNRRAGSMAQMVEFLPSMYKVLGSILSTAKKKKKNLPKNISGALVEKFCGKECRSTGYQDRVQITHN